MGSTRWMNGIRLAALAAMVFALSAGCGKKNEAPAGPAGAPGGAKRGPVPVVLGKAEARDFPVELMANGTVESVQSVPVRAQVAGTLTAVSLREGENVAAGQVLFQIDSRPLEGTLRQLEADRARWEAQAKSAEAQVRALEAQAVTVEAQARTADSQVRTAEAQATLADAQVKRYEGLVGKDFVTREQYDQIRTAAEAARSNLAASRSSAEAARSAIETVKSNIEAARANIEAARASQAATEAAIGNAKVQLGYTTIRSPVSGQAGSLLAKVGDYVKGNGDTQLVVINQMQPILVRFPVPEADLPNVQRYRKEGALSVRVELPGGGLRDGSVVFVDNAVDRTTGTIAMKARFDNADLGLWPGQFANVHLLLFTRKGAVVVPSAAVQTGQKGPYVFVVDAEGTATMRPVKPGLSRENLTIVEEGLKAGETIVTDGHLKVTPGAKVQAKNGSGADASPAPQAAQGSAK